MNSDLTKIENELLLFLNIWNDYSFRTDIYNRYNISKKTLQRYINEINNCHIFIAPIIKDKHFSEEYVLSNYSWHGKYVYYRNYDINIFNTSLEINSTDSAIATHLKRLTYIYVNYEEDLVNNLNPEYSTNFKIPSGTNLAKEIAAHFPMHRITNRTVQRDIVLLKKIINKYQELQKPCPDL